MVDICLLEARCDGLVNVRLAAAAWLFDGYSPHRHGHLAARTEAEAAAEVEQAAAVTARAEAEACGSVGRCVVWTAPAEIQRGALDFFTGVFTHTRINGATSFIYC